jgi:hypothetical protein
MADLTLNRYVSSGTAAEMATFTPVPATPASGPDFGNFFYQTDTGDLYAWDGAAWQQVGSSSAGSGITALTGDVTATGPGSVPATLANDAVTTAKILDGNVTLAKIADASANSKLLGSGAAGSGAPYAEITLGTNLSMSGTTLNASGGGGGGGWVLLEQHTASASASLDFTTCISSTYDEYRIEIVGLVPATASTNLLFRVSTDGGSTYVSSSDYAYAAWAYGPGGSGQFSSTSATSIAIVGFANLSNTSTKPETATLTLHDPESTSVHKTLSGIVSFWDTTPNLATVMLAGAYKATTAVNAFQFFYSSGNIASGTIRVYGLEK